MTETTIERFTADLKTQFAGVTKFIAVRIEHGILKGAFETMRKQLNNPKNTTGKASVTLPFGTFRTEVRTKSDVDNINVELDFSKDFLRAIKGDIELVWANPDDNETDSDNRSESFMKNFCDYVAYGMFDPDSEEHRKEIEVVQKCINMDPTERTFFLNAWTNSLVGMVREKIREGKIYRLDLNAAVWNGGSMEFELKDGEVTANYLASKDVKQAIKNAGVIEGTTVNIDDL